MERSRWHSVLVYFGFCGADQEPESPWPIVVLIVAFVACFVLTSVGLDWIALTIIGCFVLATVVQFVRKRRSGS